MNNFALKTLFIDHLIPLAKNTPFSDPTPEENQQTIAICKQMIKKTLATPFNKTVEYKQKKYILEILKNSDLTPLQLLGVVKICNHCKPCLSFFQTSDQKIWKETSKYAMRCYLRLKKQKKKHFIISTLGKVIPIFYRYLKPSEMRNLYIGLDEKSAHDDKLYLYDRFMQQKIIEIKDIVETHRYFPKLIHLTLDMRKLHPFMTITEMHSNIQFHELKKISIIEGPRLFPSINCEIFQITRRLSSLSLQFFLNPLDRLDDLKYAQIKHLKLQVTHEDFFCSSAKFSRINQFTHLKSFSLTNISTDCAEENLLPNLTHLTTLKLFNLSNRTFNHLTLHLLKQNPQMTKLTLSNTQTDPYIFEPLTKIEFLKAHPCLTDVALHHIMLTDHELAEFLSGSPHLQNLTIGRNIEVGEESNHLITNELKELKTFTLRVQLKVRG